MLERLFRLSENRTDARTEVLAGLSTFLTMSYIVFVNPAILAAAGIPFAGAMSATCLAAAASTLVMALATNYPIALAPGMGLNAFLAFGIVLGMGVPWQVGMAMVFVEGLLILVLVLTGLREAVMHAIPLTLKRAIGAGIGVFIALIGLNEGGIVRPAPVTLMTLGDVTRPHVLVALFGLVVIAALLSRRVRGGLLVGLLATAALAWAAGLSPWPGRIVQPLELSTVGAILGGDANGPYLVQALRVGLWTTIFAFMMTDFFDTMGTVIAVGEQAGFVEGGRLPRLRRVLVADSLAASIGGFCGASSATCYIESAAGVAAGGRTGLTGAVAAGCFLLAAFFAPLAGMVGGGVAVPNVEHYAQFAGFTVPGGSHHLHPVTAGALVVVGFMMMQIVRDIRFTDFEEDFPAFLVILGIPLTYSISSGIGLGFVAHVAVKAVRGRAREVQPLLWAIAAAFAANFALPWINRLGR